MRRRRESLEDIVDRADDALADGDEEAARRALAKLPPPGVALPDPLLGLDVADLCFALGDVEEAQARYRKITETDPDLSDGWYGLGASADELGDEAGKVAAWLRAHILDARAPADEAKDHLSEDDFADVAERALGELPDRARDLLRDVPIVIAERPSSEDVKAGMDPRLLGMFEGTPYPEAGPGGPVAQLARILLFRRNLEIAAQDADHLREEIRTTLIHETGHFFGLDEDDLEAVGLG